MKRQLAALAAAALLISGCSDPTEEKTSGAPEGAADGGSETITIGSAAFPESEIIAEIYAQALEAKGVEVERKMQIGSREVYAKALESGEIDLVPEYTGNLLTFFDPKTEAAGPEEIEAALPEALPEGTKILAAAEAEDKDSLNVTRETAEEHNLSTIADLAELDKVSIAANPEFAERSYGIPGLAEVYGVTDVDFVPIDDGGGPATVKALLDGDVIVANVYSTTPAIGENDLVTLDDPENLIAAQRVVPFIRTEAATDDVVAVLDAISQILTTEDLIEMNTRSAGDEKASPATIAEDWLADHPLN